MKIAIISYFIFLISLAAIIKVLAHDAEIVINDKSTDMSVGCNLQGAEGFFKFGPDMAEKDKISVSGKVMVTCGNRVLDLEISGRATVH